MLASAKPPSGVQHRVELADLNFKGLLVSQAAPASVGAPAQLDSASPGMVPKIMMEPLDGSHRSVQDQEGLGDRG